MATIEEILGDKETVKPKTPAEVKEQDELNGSVILDFSSKEDSGGSQFLPLEEDFYVLTVESAEVRERPNYNDNSIMEKVIMITFYVEKTVSGGPIKDIEGNVQEKDTRKFWEFLSTTALGFTGAGKPSKTRACISALNGADPNDELKGIKIDDLVGKSCKAMMEVVAKQDGDKRNKVVKYSAL